MFLYSFSSFGSAQAGMGLPGVHALYAGDDWEFFTSVLEGDEVFCTLMLSDVIEKESGWGQVRQIEEFRYKNKNTGRLIARCRRLMFRAEGNAAAQKGKYSGPRAKHRYTDTELKAIVDQYKKERIQRRGADPLYWENIEVGEEIPPILKGPLTVTEMITWLMGWGSPLCKSSRIAHLFMHRHPKAAVRDPETGVPDLPERAHWDESYAKAAGVGSGYDIGTQRISWFAHLMTDWIGDSGFLKKLNVQLRRPNYLGDLLWCRGRVCGKHTGSGEHLVECELWGDNQRNERIALGWATAVVPSRAA
jgi:hypothetical protein